MTDESSNDAGWISTWIEQQRKRLRELIEEGAAGPRPRAGDWQGLLARWLDSLNAGVHAGPDAFPWAEWISGLPPLGIARPAMQLLEEIASAREACGRFERALREALLRVQLDALDELDVEARDRAARGERIEEIRELYDSWIEAAERLYARRAHSDEYCQLLADAGNASIRLRAAEQAVIEQMLKHYDLPTRSELNTVHRQMRELRARIAQLEEQLARAEGSGS